MNRKSYWIFLIGLHVLFFAKQLFFGNSIIQDSKEYVFAAENLANHSTLYAWNMNHAWNPDWLSKRPILYPALLLLFKTMSFGNTAVFLCITYLFQNLASLLCFYFCFQILEKLRYTIPWKKAAMYTLFCLPQFIYANLIMSEIFLQLCLVSIVYLVILYPPNFKIILSISLLLTAALALKPVMLFAVEGGIFLMGIWTMRYYKKMKLSLYAISFIPMFYQVFTSYWNKTRTGYYHYSSITTINLLHYNTYSCLMYTYGEAKSDSIIDDIHTKAQVLPSYSAEEEYIQKACKNILSKHKSTYIYLHARGILFCLLDPGRFDITQFFNLPHSGNLLFEGNKIGGINSFIKIFSNPLGIVLFIILLFNAFRAFVILKFVFSRQFTLSLKTTLLMFPVYILALTGPIGTSRFFMPLIPIIFIVFLLQNSTNKIG